MNTHAQKKSKRKHFSSQTSLGVKFTRPSVIMKKGLLKLLDIIWQIDHILDHRNDVIKFSKLKWNHEPQTSGFTAKLWTFYGVISMVYKSVDHGKLWSIGFYNNIFFFFTKNQKQNNRHWETCYVICTVYTLIDHSSRPISARGFAQLL